MPQGKLIDETGKRFFKLTVLRRGENNRAGGARWIAQCDCGKEILVRGADLRRGHTISCGCEAIRRGKLVNTTHGMSKTLIYQTWQNIMDRCYNKNCSHYKYYGGRGITVCKRWHKFENFRDDMFSTWKPHLSIERIDNNQGYSLRNCKWIPKTDQPKNRRNVRRVKNSLGQVFDSPTEAGKEMGVDRTSIYMVLGGKKGRVSAGKCPKTGEKIKWWYL